MIENGWYCCPNCGRRLFKLDPSAVIHGVSIKCRGSADKPRCGLIKVNVDSKKSQHDR